MILNKDRIPKLPRVLAAHYDTVPFEDRQVLARLGARDPTGVQVAMKRYGATTLQELIDQLEHQQPQRDFMQRLEKGIGRAVGGEDHDPHRADILKALRRPDAKQKDIEQRIKRVRKSFKETNR